MFAHTGIFLKIRLHCIINLPCTLAAVLKKSTKTFSSTIDGDYILGYIVFSVDNVEEIPIAEVPFLQRDVNKPAVNFAQVREQYFR